MRVAVDAMGSDNAPDIEIEGAVEASRTSDTEIILVGDEAVLTEKLEAFPKRGNISVVHAAQAIDMHESPVMAVRSKKEASVLVALRLVKQGKADAVVSAGNTGAVMVGSRSVLGPLRGVARAALSQCMPTASGYAVVLDLGANVDCTVRHLCEFAEMGIAFSHYAMGVEHPRVGLLNIGEEMLKGGAVAREAHQRLRSFSHMNFIGNVEPKAVFRGDVDVVVCDGFVGNLFLKTGEAVASFMGEMLREHFMSSGRSKLGAVFAGKAIKQLKKRVDPNEYPGAPLLGINGISIVMHGSVKARGITTAIEGACNAVEMKLNEHIKENIEMLRNEEAAMETGAAPEAPQDATT